MNRAQQLLAMVEFTKASGMGSRGKSPYDMEYGNLGIIFTDHSSHNQTRFDIYIYEGLDNFGKRGKRITRHNWGLWAPASKSRTAWGATFQHRVEKKRLTLQEWEKAFDELVAEIAREEEVQPQSHKQKEELKAVDPTIPFPSKFVPVDFSGKDITVQFGGRNRASVINITSKMDSASLEKGHQIGFIEVKNTLANAQKIVKAREDISKSTGLGDVATILSRLKVPHDQRIYMDPMFR